MSKSAFITARIEPKLKARASRVLTKVGVSTTDAITMFFRQVVLRGGLPFDVRVPNSATGKAIEALEASRGEILRRRTRGSASQEAKERERSNDEARIGLALGGLQ